MQGGESWASAFLVVVGIEKNCLDLQFMVCYISCKQRKILLEYVTSIWIERFSQCSYSVYCPIVGIVLLCCTILFVCKRICDVSISHREYLSVVHLNSSTWLFLKI